MRRLVGETVRASPVTPSLTQDRGLVRRPAAW
jgi:hypothetical protein